MLWQGTDQNIRDLESRRPSETMQGSGTRVREWERGYNITEGEEEALSGSLQPTP